MLKVYNEYKMIEIKDIKGIERKEHDLKYFDRIKMARFKIRRYGLTEPFEVIKVNDNYIIMKKSESLIAAKQLNYTAVPCLIRNPLHEIILRKTLRNLDMEY